MNKEAVNDRAKLVYHRWIARRLGRDGNLIDKARAVVATYPARYGNAPFVQAWFNLLDQPLDVVRKRITERLEEADTLRSTSPLPLVAELQIHDQSVRRRLWRKASRSAQSKM